MYIGVQEDISGCFSNLKKKFFWSYDDFEINLLSEHIF